MPFKFIDRVFPNTKDIPQKNRFLLEFPESFPIKNYHVHSFQKEEMSFTTVRRNIFNFEFSIYGEGEIPENVTDTELLNTLKLAFDTGIGMTFSNLDATGLPIVITEYSNVLPVSLTPKKYSYDDDAPKSWVLTCTFESKTEKSINNA